MTYAQDGLAIAVLLPCYNEALTIGDVVRGFADGAARRRRLRLRQQFHRRHGARRRACRRARLPRGAAGQGQRRAAHVRRHRRRHLRHGRRRRHLRPGRRASLVNALITERVDMVVGTRRGVGARRRALRPRLRQPHASTGSTAGSSAAASPTSFPATAPSRAASSRAFRRSRPASRSRRR